MGIRTGKPRGRPKGARNKATNARQAAVKASGSTPLDVMLKRMRHHEHLAALAKRRKDEAAENQHLAAADEAARGAAPYVHPRLSAVQMSGNLTLTHEERLEKLK